KRADQHDGDRRRQNAETRNAPADQPVVHGRRQSVDDAENPDERRHADEQRHRDEEAREEAAAEPLHRSYRRPAAIAARSARPSAMRYQANGANPERRTKVMNGPTTAADATKAMTKPTAMSTVRPAPS